MSKNTFLITGFGRTGTAFLASVMRRSKSWQVEHEPAGDQDGLNRAINRFSSREFYGEVNSRVRNWLRQIPAARKAIVLRDPRDIAVSVFNRHPQSVVKRLAGVWTLLDSYLQEGVKTFYFEQFTTSAESLDDLVRWTGIDDVEINESWLATPVNATRTQHIRHYDEIPIDTLNSIDAEIQRFLKKNFS